MLIALLGLCTGEGKSLVLPAYELRVSYLLQHVSVSLRERVGAVVEVAQYQLYIGNYIQTYLGTEAVLVSLVG